MRGLYRFYLYTVCILLSIYATYTCTRLLSVLLQFTPLRASYESQPSSSDVVQAGTLALVSFVVVLLIGGLHYWLIRRDITQDTEAGTSAIRSFFLNIPGGFAVALSVPTLGFTLLTLASSSGVASSLAFGLSTLLLALLLELERRRSAAPPHGVGTTFRRIHLYGVQAILLFVLGISWSSIILPLVDGVFLGGRVQAASCAGDSQCPHPNLFLLALAGIWFVAGWLFYGWLTSRDSSHFLRFILHGLGFAIGIGILLAGLYNLFDLLFLLLFGEPAALSAILGTGARYNVVGLLTLGVLIAGMYHLWMRAGVRQGRLPGHASLHLIELAILSVLAASTFWWGLGTLLYNTFALLFKFPQMADKESWLSALAFVLAGCMSIPIEFYLQRKNRREPAIAVGSRRAQVFALLAIGTLTLSIAIATTLYIVLTTLLRSPITDWTQVLSFGLATLLVGLLLAGFYFYTALNEHQFSRRLKTTSKPATEREPRQRTELATIENILSQLLANQLTRAEASEKLHQLMHVSDVQQAPSQKNDPSL